MLFSRTLFYSQKLLYIDNWWARINDRVLHLFFHHLICIIPFTGAHPPHEISHLLQKIEQRMREMWVHLEHPGYVTLLSFWYMMNSSYFTNY